MAMSSFTESKVSEQDLMELELLHLLGVSQFYGLIVSRSLKDLRAKTVPCLGQQRGRALVGGERWCGSSIFWGKWWKTK